MRSSTYKTSLKPLLGERTFRLHKVAGCGKEAREAPPKSQGEGFLHKTMLQY